ncbi:MAG: hypothetical protein AB8E15_00660 [Bdellovibrionales bacterium]
MIRRLTSSIVLLFILFMSYGLLISNYSIQITPAEISTVPASTNPYYTYRGITHVESQYGRGSGSIEKISLAAQSEGIDFVFITDLNQYEEPSYIERKINDVYMIRGGKYSYVDSHLLVFGGLKDHKFKSPGQSQILMSDLLTQKNRGPDTMSIHISHPTRPRYEWTGRYPIGLNGLEIFNLKEFWDRKFREERGHFLWSLLLYPFNENLFYANIVEPPHKELALWNKLMTKQNVIGLFGHHATAKAVVLPSDSGYWEFPKYETFFRTGANNIVLRSELTGNFERDKAKILTALKNGNSFLSLDLIGNASSFFVEVKQKEKSFLIGEEIDLKNRPTKIHYRLPEITSDFEVQLLKDGELYMSSNQLENNFDINMAGNYRIQVLVKLDMPFPAKAKSLYWIITNHFYVK